MNRAVRIRWGTAVALLVALPSAYLLLAPGPTETPVDPWHLETTDGELLCSDEIPCEDAIRSALHEEGLACLWSGNIRLDGSNHPAVLRRLETVLYVSAWRGPPGPDGSGHALTTDWDLGGSWWRAFGKETQVSIPVPCDVAHVTFSFNVSGIATTGRSFQEAHVVETELGFAT